MDSGSRRDDLGACVDGMISIAAVVALLVLAGGVIGLARRASF